MKELIQLSLALLFLASVQLSATEPTNMGEEHFGNKPLNALNFKDWPGVVPVVNDKNRVYHQWVNGSEFCCYRGETAALNIALANFSKVESKILEVVLRPGVGIAQTFTKGKTVEYDWRLHLNGGIAAHMSTRDQGEQIWPTYPVLTIQVTDRIELDKLEIPDNVTLLQISDLKTRYSKGMTSTDQTVRGWSLGRLAVLDKYDTEIMNRIAAKLDDKDNWVRLNALMTLASYGSRASSHVNKIKLSLASDDPQLKNQAAKTLAAIGSKTAEKTKSPHRAINRKIKTFVEGRK